MGVSAQDDDLEGDGDATFERAKRPMVLAAVAVAVGLAIAGSVERTAGGAIVLGAWVVAIFALHRLGRAGSASRPAGLGPQAGDEKPSEATSEPEGKRDAEDESDAAPESGRDSERDTG